MLVHIGKDKLISDKDIIGIFDLENTTSDDESCTAEFLSEAEKNGNAEYVLSLDISKAIDTPRAFVVCGSKRNGKKVYITGFSSETLLKKTENALKRGY